MQRPFLDDQPSLPLENFANHRPSASTTRRFVRIPSGCTDSRLLKLFGTRGSRAVTIPNRVSGLVWTGEWVIVALITHSRLLLSGSPQIILILLFVIQTLAQSLDCIFARIRTNPNVLSITM